jgi:nucleoside-diphosphate kinase
MERTLAIIKPDAVSRNLTGKILSIIEANEFKIKAMKMCSLTKREAEGFYYVHKEKPFFEGLTNFMSSGPIVVLLLERKGAIEKLREIMGATDPKKADICTIRREYGLDVEKNSIHGSDSKESADFEISYFFSDLEILK